MKFFMKKTMLLFAVFAFFMAPAVVIAGDQTVIVNNKAAQVSKISKVDSVNYHHNGQKKKRPSGAFIALLLLIIFIVVSAPILFIIWLSVRRNKQ